MCPFVFFNDTSKSSHNTFHVVYIKNKQTKKNIAQVANMNSQRFPVQKEVWKNSQKVKKQSPVYLTVNRYQQQQQQQIPNGNLFNISEATESLPGTPVARREIKMEPLAEPPHVAQKLQPPQPINENLTTGVDIGVIAFTQSVKLVCDAINGLNETISSMLQHQTQTQMQQLGPQIPIT